MHKQPAPGQLLAFDFKSLRIPGSALQVIGLFILPGSGSHPCSAIRAGRAPLTILRSQGYRGGTGGPLQAARSIGPCSKAPPTKVEPRRCEITPKPATLHCKSPNCSTDTQRADVQSLQTTRMVAAREALLSEIDCMQQKFFSGLP